MDIKDATTEHLENLQLRKNTTFFNTFITDLARLYQLVYYKVLIEAVGGHFPQKSNDDSLPCFLYLSFYYAVG